MTHEAHRLLDGANICCFFESLCSVFAYVNNLNIVLVQGGKDPGALNLIIYDAGPLGYKPG